MSRSVRRTNAAIFCIRRSANCNCACRDSGVLGLFCKRVEPRNCYLRKHKCACFRWNDCKRGLALRDQILITLYGCRIRLVGIQLKIWRIKFGNIGQLLFDNAQCSKRNNARHRFTGNEGIPLWPFFINPYHFRREP